MESRPTGLFKAVAGVPEMEGNKARLVNLITSVRHFYYRQGLDNTLFGRVDELFETLLRGKEFRRDELVGVALAGTGTSIISLKTFIFCLSFSQVLPIYSTERDGKAPQLQVE